MVNQHCASRVIALRREEISRFEKARGRRTNFAKVARVVISPIHRVIARQCAMLSSRELKPRDVNGSREVRILSSRVCRK